MHGLAGHPRLQPVRAARPVEGPAVWAAYFWPGLWVLRVRIVPLSPTPPFLLPSIFFRTSEGDPMLYSMHVPYLFIH